MLCGPPLSWSSHWTHRSFRNPVFPQFRTISCRRTGITGRRYSSWECERQNVNLASGYRDNEKMHPWPTFLTVLYKFITTEKCKIYSSKTWAMYGESGLDWSFWTPCAHWARIDLSYVTVLTVKRKPFTLNGPLSHEGSLSLGFVCTPKISGIPCTRITQVEWW